LDYRAPISKNKDVLLINITLLVTIFFINHLLDAFASVDLLYIAPVAWVSFYLNFFIGFIFTVCIFILESIQALPEVHQNQYVIFNDLFIFLFLIVIAYISYKLKLKLILEEEHSGIDHLTMLNNRSSFLEKLDIELHRIKRNPGDFSICYMSIHDIKNVMKEIGKKETDHLLAATGYTIGHCTRATDITARLCEDDFVILLAQTNHQQAEIAFQKIYVRLKRMLKDRGWSIHFKIGLVTYQSPPGSAETTLSHAEQLMETLGDSDKDNIKHILVE